MSAILNGGAIGAMLGAVASWLYIHEYASEGYPEFYGYSYFFWGSVTYAMLDKFLKMTVLTMLVSTAMGMGLGALFKIVKHNGKAGN